MSRMTVGHLLDRSAQIWPDKVAVVADDVSLTYAALQALSCRFARLLQSRGIAESDRIALVFPNSPEFVVCFFGVARIGAVLVPLNPAYTDGELTGILQDADVREIFCVPTHQDRLEAFRLGIPNIRAVTPVGGLEELQALCSDCSDACFNAAIDESAAHAIMFTSGTTGSVKGAILSHRTRVASTLASRIGYDITSRTRANVPAPMFHSGGMILGLLSVLAAGGTLLLPRSGGVDATAGAFVQHGANLLLTVPTQVFRWVEDSQFGRVARDRSFALIHGAAPMPEALVHRLLDGFPKCRPFHGYGSTEACQLTVLGPEEYRRVPAATGRALPGVDVRVVDDRGRDVAPGDVGEIVTAGPHVFDGYLNAPEQTAEALRDGVHWTGDLATMDERGIISIVGRRKDLIISGGYNVYPREVENVLQAHPAVREAVVFGVPDVEWGETVAAAIVVNPGMNADENDIVAYCRKHLAPYKKPKHVLFVADFPRNAIGKIQKSRLTSKA